MPPSTLLQALLTSLAQAQQGTTLALDDHTIGGTSAAPFLQLLADELQLAALTLNNAKLPEAVTGQTLVISGDNQGVTLELSFQDTAGELAIQALFQAPQLAPLQRLFPGLPATFFSGITVAGAGAATTASVTVPGLGPKLVFAQPLLGVIGLAAPSSGLVTTSIAPRVDGQVTPSDGGARALFVELATATSGYRVSPPPQATWTFDDFTWLLPGLSILGAFPAIILRTNLGLRTFDLNLYPDAPSFSSLSLDVADITSPEQPLWSAAGGKVQLTDVVVTLGLSYARTLALSLTGTGSVQGNFVLGALVLEAQIPFPLSGVWSLTAFPNARLPGLDDLARLLDGGKGQLDGLMPAGLSALDSFELTYLRLAVDASTFSLVEFTFALGSTATWPLIPGVVELDSLQIQMTIDGAPSIRGSVIGTLGLPDHAELVVSFGRTDARLPWRLDAISPAVALPSLGTLASLAQGTDSASLVQAGGLGQLRFVMTDLNFGMTISPTKLTNLGLTLQLANASAPLDPKLDWELIPDVLTLTDFEFGFQLAWGAQTTKDVFGRFVVNGLEFDVKFAEQSDGNETTDALIAEYSAQGAAGSVDVQALIAAISPSLGALVPEKLTIDLADALLVYFNRGGTKKYLFAMDISLELPISDLPLVGKALPSDAKVGLKNLKVVIASEAMSAEDVTFINGMSPKPVLPLPQSTATGPAIPSGFSMVAELELGPVSVLMTSPPARSQAVSGTSVRRELAAPGALTTPAADPVMWIDVQKTFGPVAIQKVGFAYRSGSLFALSNLALAVGGLEIELIGIGIGSPIADPKPTFTIQGLAVSFQEGPISVQGGMIGTIDPLDFTGALSVRGPELALAAFAGYREYEGHPSFFLYGVLDAPIGGPPPFFVTGVAAGFGFNRKLVVPDVTGVVTFPLVEWAQGNGTPVMDPTQPIAGQVADVLSRLARSGVVAPSVGDYWFAAGVQFSSFELVQSFALVTVSFGTDVEIALLGLSTLTLPPDDPSPVAEVQLALEVSFSYSRGLLAVAGQLTNNSYVLSRAARLTGGFAFYLWFSGEHAGETVLTLGGYNPNFAVPSYYPVVPRLGLAWQLDGLSITGGLYFALTSNVVMAGGKLSATWEGGPIRAWFTYWADFLMTFRPFHYYVDGGIDLGASFTIDLLFFSVSITIHVGVEIAIWGPDFSGRATVDLSIVSFTIGFGPTPEHAPPTAIGWGEFTQKLLPSQPAQPQALRTRARRGRPAIVGDAAPGDPPAQAAVVQINVTSGLVRALKPTADGPRYLITAEKFECAVLTVIPSKAVTLGASRLGWSDQQPKGRDGQPIAINTDFGVGPANLSPASFQPALALAVTSSKDSTLHAVKRFSTAPKALWEHKQFDGHGVPQVDPGNALTQSTIPDALVGLTLTPYLDRPDRTLAIPLPSLLFTLDDNVQPFAWSPGVPPTSDPFSGETVAGTITAAGVAGVRSALIGALAGQGVTVATDVDVARLADPATPDLQAAPRLRLLGEQAAAA